MGDEVKMPTFGLVFVPLVSEKAEVTCENVEFLSHGIEGLIEPPMGMLSRPLSGRAGRLKAPMLVKMEVIRLGGRD